MNSKIKILVLLFASAMLSGCASYGYKVVETHTNADGTTYTVETRKTQATMQLEAKLQFANNQLNNQDMNGYQDYKPESGCSGIAAPGADASSAVFTAYYNAVNMCSMRMASGSSSLDHRAIAAIRGEPATDFGVAFQEMERTERNRQDNSFRKTQLWANLGLGVANIAKDIYIADNYGEGSTGNGGVYVRGDVITTQTASNSRSNSGATSNGGAGEAAGAGGAIGDTEQKRLISQSVFGNSGNALYDEGSRGAYSGAGPSIQLEPSANGFATEDSELKGVVTSDTWDQNADFNYDDSGDGLNASF